MKKILIGISVVIAALIVITFIHVYIRPFGLTEEDQMKSKERYQQERYSNAKALYLEDSIYYSNFKDISASTEAIWDKVEYKTPTVLVEKKRKDLISKMATPEDIKQELTWAMGNRGGVLDIKIYATTYEGANTGNYRIVITDMDSKELYREDLESRNALATNYDRKFQNSATVRLKDRMPIPFKVYIINLLSSSREEFIIDELENLSVEYRLGRIKELEKSLSNQNRNIEIFEGNMTFSTNRDPKKDEQELENMRRGRDNTEKKIEYIKSLNRAE